MGEGGRMIQIVFYNWPTIQGIVQGPARFTESLLVDEDEGWLLQFSIRRRDTGYTLSGAFTKQVIATKTLSLGLGL